MREGVRAECVHAECVCACVCVWGGGGAGGGGGMWEEAALTYSHEVSECGWVGEVGGGGVW